MVFDVCTRNYVENSNGLTRLDINGQAVAKQVLDMIKYKYKEVIQMQGYYYKSVYFRQNQAHKLEALKEAGIKLSELARKAVDAEYEKLMKELENK